MGHHTIDDAGRLVALRRPPDRLVSLVPSVTELVCRLGAADRLVAVTRYCTHPAAVVAKRPKVGGTKTPRCDQIIALTPDVVLFSSEENRREDFTTLVRAGLPIFVTFARSVRDAARSIERLAALLKLERRGATLAREINQSRDEVSAAASRRLRVFCPIWRNPWMTFNGDTFAHDLLRCAGGANVCADAADRYPAIDLRDVAASKPEVILLPDEPYRFSERHLKSLRPLVQTPAWEHKRVYLVDGKALFWYGPRTPAALHYVHGLLAGKVPESSKTPDDP